MIFIVCEMASAHSFFLGRVQLVKSRVQVTDDISRVGFKVRANPSNTESLNNLIILIAVPPFGEWFRQLCTNDINMNLSVVLTLLSLVYVQFKGRPSRCREREASGKVFPAK